MNVLYGGSSACSGIFRLEVAEPAHKRILSAAQHQIKTLAFLLVTRSLTIQESIIAKVRPASRQTITKGDSHSSSTQTWFAPSRAAHN